MFHWYYRWYLAFFFNYWQQLLFDSVANYASELSIKISQINNDYPCQKSWKEKIWVRKRRVSFFSILKISGTTKLQTGRPGWPPTHSNVIQQPQDYIKWPTKEWQMAARVKCMARTVRNKLWGSELKSCKARKTSFINKKQRSARLKFAEGHKDWTVEDWRSTTLMSPIFSFAKHLRLDGDLERPTSHSVLHKFGGGLMMIWWCWNQEHSSLWRTHESSHIQGCP